MSASITFDWVSFTDVSTNNPDDVITEYLQLPVGDFSELGYGIRGYRSCKYLDNIRVYYNGREGSADSLGRGTEFMGVYVLLSGDGCRQYTTMGKDVLELLSRVHGGSSARVTRVDLAHDDKAGLLDFDRMLAYNANEQIRTRSIARDVYSSRKGKVAPAQTIYIGSRSSNKYVRIYDKAKEQYHPHKEPEKYNSHWVRVEMVLRHENAVNAVRYILQECERDKPLGESFAEILNGFMTFIELDDSNISRCSVADWWAAFLGTLRAVKLPSKEKARHQFARKLRWFFDNIAPMASAFLEGLGERNLMRVIAVASLKRKEEYAKMLKIYKEDSDRDGVPAMLGYEYLRLSEQYRRNPMPKAVWDSFTNAEEVRRGEFLTYEITEGMKEYEQLETVFAS